MVSDIDIAIYWVLELLGTGLVFFLAYRSFDKRSLQLGDEPTLPQYFTRTELYALGIAIYCVSLAGVYFLLTWHWFSLQPLIMVVVQNLQAGDFVNLITSLDGAKLIPLIIAGVYLFLVAWDSKLNPLLLFRDTIYDVFAIPRKAVDVYNALRLSRLSQIDEELRQQVASRLLVTSVDPGDFDKASATVEYKWAHNCVLFDQIQRYANQGSYRRFFTEPSLKWGDICVFFNQMSEQVAAWKVSEPHYTKTVKLLKDLDVLTGLLSRFLACLVIFGSASEKEIWETVRRLGGNVHEARLKHTYKYLLIFMAATVIGVMVGRELSVFLHNHLFYPEDPLRQFSDETFSWIVYAVCIYVLPITLVFLMRRIATIATIQGPDGATVHYGFYTAVMIVGFVVSTAVSALILNLSGQDNGSFNFVQSFLQSMRWGILPALMSGFVAYQMDNPPKNPPSKYKLIESQVLRFVGWGFVGMIIMLYATDNLTIEKPQLRFIIVGTTVFVVGFLGMAARFKTIRLSS